MSNDIKLIVNGNELGLSKKQLVTLGLYTETVDEQKEKFSLDVFINVELYLYPKSSPKFGSICYRKDGKIILEFNIKSKVLWVNGFIWNNFQCQFKCNEEETSNFFTESANKYFTFEPLQSMNDRFYSNII